MTGTVVVALMMAGGGASPDPETLELLQHALDHDVRVAAEYAQLVASELVHPPLALRGEQENELEEILRPARPVAGKPNWVTALAGYPGTSDSPARDLSIYCAMDVRTALHVVRHPALGDLHLALHGKAVEATAASLVEKLGAEILDGPPENWNRTRADPLNLRPEPPGQ